MIRTLTAETERAPTQPFLPGQFPIRTHGKVALGFSREAVVVRQEEGITHITVEVPNQKVMEALQAEINRQDINRMTLQSAWPNKPMQLELEAGKSTTRQYTVARPENTRWNIRVRPSLIQRLLGRG